ncbi:MAG: hypothetical protein AB7F25_01760 [Deferribacterales bacterium]
MTINPNSSVVNLREKLLQMDRKKTQSESEDVNSGNNSAESVSADKQYMSDVIGIRNENRLAVQSSNAITSKDEAFEMLETLKQKFSDSSETALNAHKKADPNTVMQFYPFE